MRNPVLQACLALIVLSGSASAQELSPDVDPSADRRLGPERDVAVLGFPLDAALTATAGAPQFALEVRVDLGSGLALALRPMGIWYLPNSRREVHGGGVGGAVALHWYMERALAGPFFAFQTGDVEAFIGGGRGRMIGASAIFGYAISYESGALISMGVGLGYWHRMGVLDTGTQWPEILSLRFGAGWGFGDRR